MRKRVEKPFHKEKQIRRYYVHKRHNGIIYAELIDQKTGKKIPARSTRTRNYDEAILVIADWLANGIKTAKKANSRPFEAFCDIKSIIKTIRKTELSPEETVRYALFPIYWISGIMSIQSISKSVFPTGIVS